MIWRSTAQILVSFVVAGAAVWYSPLLGLGEFTFLGQLAAVVLALSVLEALFRRLDQAREG